MSEVRQLEPAVRNRSGQPERVNRFRSLPHHCSGDGFYVPAAAPRSPAALLPDGLSAKLLAHENAIVAGLGAASYLSS